MPPASRNQRVPRAGATPTPAAASSLERPAAIDTQNWRRSSRRATEGRPGDRNAPRRHRSERRLRGSTATSLVEVLRRPLEPALDAPLGEACGDTADLLERPADEAGRGRASLSSVFGGGGWLAWWRITASMAKASITSETWRCQPCQLRVSL